MKKYTDVTKKNDTKITARICINIDNITLKFTRKDKEVRIA